MIRIVNRFVSNNTTEHSFSSLTDSYIPYFHTHTLEKSTHYALYFMCFLVYVPCFSVLCFIFNVMSHVFNPMFHIVPLFYAPHQLNKSLVKKKDLRQPWGSLLKLRLKAFAKVWPITDALKASKDISMHRFQNICMTCYRQKSTVIFEEKQPPKGLCRWQGIWVFWLWEEL